MKLSLEYLDGQWSNPRGINKQCEVDTGGVINCNITVYRLVVESVSTRNKDQKQD